MALDLSFKELADAAAAGAGMDGRPLLIPLSKIDEDDGQPRRVFNEDELVQLADSIRLVGILQPVVVRPAEVSGRYLITMGARRYRAARLAGLDVVPAIVQEGGVPNRYAQIIENIQRDDLAAAEIASFILARLDAGEKQSDLARKLGKPRDWVSRFAVIPRMPGFLQEKLHTSSIRAVYELYQAWRVRPGAIVRLCTAQDSFTDAQARGIARDLRSSVSLPDVETSSDNPFATAGIDSVSLDAPTTAQKELDPKPRPRSPREQRRSKSAISILVQHGGRLGRLLTDAPANNGSRFAAVRFFETGETEEVPVSELRIEEIAPC
ncbi:ParB/RepB/Spo0J family partition protein [Methylocystis echinoides]|uniref:Chromosome partitioning protein ParB n=1 Tax=Methylocystis echinoides TaxID=29468 RepID=A0A9W6GZY2_9HYPH|nr:ParB/RepB/Spo0J family partition protein [Methylocystis echinoides]GLI96048.1 chromosome partitioning protein ParB [Methylocystis echinoides]